VIEECAAFPAGENDDYVDTVTMAIQRFRQGGWIGTVNDDDEDMKKIKKRKLEYY
jgi:phage terminase large subunit-like protein